MAKFGLGTCAVIVMGMLLASATVAQGKCGPCEKRTVRKTLFHGGTPC